jgi:hypothetical protein
MPVTITDVLKLIAGTLRGNHSNLTRALVHQKRRFEVLILVLEHLLKIAVLRQNTQLSAIKKLTSVNADGNSVTDGEDKLHAQLEAAKHKYAQISANVDSLTTSLERCRRMQPIVLNPIEKALVGLQEAVHECTIWGLQMGSVCDIASLHNTTNTLTRDLTVLPDRGADGSTGELRTPKKCKRK